MKVYFLMKDGLPIKVMSNDNNIEFVFTDITNPDPEVEEKRERDFKNQCEKDNCFEVDFEIMDENEEI